MNQINNQEAVKNRTPYLFCAKGIAVASILGVLTINSPAEAKEQRWICKYPKGGVSTTIIFGDTSNGTACEHNKVKGEIQGGKCVTNDKVISFVGGKQGVSVLRQTTGETFTPKFCKEVQLP